MRFIWPFDSHAISRDFYYRGPIYIGGQHMAVDIPAGSGTPVRSVAEGLVTETGYTDINGHYVEVSHNYGWITKYRHLVGPASVDTGAVVSQGQVIGSVGSTGWSTGPHLHFDLWNASKQSPEAVYKVGLWAHDPELYLGQEDEMTPEQERIIKELIVAQTAYLEERQNQIHAALKTQLNALKVDVGAIQISGGLKRGDEVILS